MAPEEIKFHLLHLSLLREYLGHEFGAVKKNIDFFDLEKIIDDFVLMSFLVGNDFIPHLPKLHIHHDALPVLFKTYINVLPLLNGYINESGYLNLERFEIFMSKLSEYDYRKFNEDSDFGYLENKSKYDKHELDTSSKVLKKLENMGFSNQMLEELAELDAFDEEVDDDEEDDDDDESETEFIHHKRDYYINKLEYANVTPDVLKDQAEGYVRAIQWNLHYYYNGVVSWSWYYPHHYAPYISDIKNFKDMDIQFELGEPFLPFQQLLAVLPVQSKEFLPKSYQDLMCNDDSPLQDCYPSDFLTDLNGKQQEWEAVVLIPFINEKLLLNCTTEADKHLTEEEKSRNRHGPHLLYTFTKKSFGPCESFLPPYFPSINENHAECQLLDKDFFRLPAYKIKKGLCDGVILDTLFLGFPTLKHIKHSAELSNQRVKVFQMVSQKDNMMITIAEHKETNIKKVANNILGKVIFVDWPHVKESLVVAVSDGKIKYSIEKPDIPISMKDYEYDVWKSQVQSIEEFYYQRRGIYIGEIYILIHVKNVTGSRLVYTANGEIKEEKQWSVSSTNHAFQTVVNAVDVHIPVVETKETMKELFSIESIIFTLGQPHYGCMGKIVDNDIQKNNGCVIVNLSIPSEPDLECVIRNKNNLAVEHYMPIYIAAQRLGVKSHFISRLTGTFLIQTNSKESRSPNFVNIGLNLKFNKKNEEVSGYTKKSKDQWLYSNQTVELLEKYLSKFPEFFERLIWFIENDVVYLEDIYPDGKGKEIVQEMSSWLKSQHCTSADRTECGFECLDKGVIAAIEQLIDHYVLNFKTTNKKFSIKPQLLYNPFCCKGSSMPDPTTIFRIFDRVVNARDSSTVPLGLRGTIVGIRKADKECDYLYAVVFDKEFFGGMTMHCNSRRGYFIPPYALINITHGQRQAYGNKPLKKRIDYENLSFNAEEQHKSLQVKNNSSQGCVSRNVLFPNKVFAAGIAGVLNNPEPKIQILSKTNEMSPAQLQNQPFYKTGIIADKKSQITDSSFNVLSSGKNLQLSPEKQFVMPKASPGNLGCNKALTSLIKKNAETSTYHDTWNELKKKSSNEPSSVMTVTQPTSRHNYGKQLSVEELFQAVDSRKDADKSNFTYFTPPASKNSCNSNQNGSAVIKLMNHCTNMFSRMPLYSYHTIGMTGLKIATVTLPDGKKYTSVQSRTQAEAAENAAEQALAFLQRTHQQTKNQTVVRQRDIGQVMHGTYPVNPVDIMSDTQSMTYNSYGMPFINTPLPPPFSLPLLRYPCPPRTAFIPDSFVKQNQQILAGHSPGSFISAENVRMPVNLFPVQSPFENTFHVKDSTLKTSTNPVEKQPSEESRNVFVPLQVKKNSSKLTKEETSSVLSKNEWPVLPSTGNSKPVEISNINMLNSEKHMIETPVEKKSSYSEKAKSNINSSNVPSDHSNINKVQPPKVVRKPRIAAKFSNC